MGRSQAVLCVFTSEETKLLLYIPAWVASTSCKYLSNISLSMYFGQFWHWQRYSLPSSRSSSRDFPVISSAWWCHLQGPRHTVIPLRWQLQPGLFTSFPIFISFPLLGLKLISHLSDGCCTLSQSLCSIALLVAPHFIHISDINSKHIQLSFHFTWQVIFTHQKQQKSQHWALRDPTWYVFSSFLLDCQQSVQTAPSDTSLQI